MKKLVVILGVIFIGLSGFNTATDKPDKALVKQIYVMLEDLPLEIEEEILVEVKLKINQQNQIEVLAVGADDPLIRKLIKKRLDNEMLTVQLPAERSYLLPIRIKL